MGGRKISLTVDGVSVGSLVIAITLVFGRLEDIVDCSFVFKNHIGARLEGLQRPTPTLGHEAVPVGAESFVQPLFDATNLYLKKKKMSVYGQTPNFVKVTTKYARFKG